MCELSRCDTEIEVGLSHVLEGHNPRSTHMDHEQSCKDHLSYIMYHVVCVCTKSSLSSLSINAVVVVDFQSSSTGPAVQHHHISMVQSTL